jgi:hypothetical protein
MRKFDGNNHWLGQLLYGSLFVVFLPSLLAIWAWQLDRSSTVFWPIPFQPWVGVLLLIAGLMLMVFSMCALWVLGKGLPMNAYPPSHYVASASYALFSHPIYLGFVVTVAGISIALASPAGLWVVTPVMALAVMALVVGYEGPRLRERFADAIQRPLVSIPSHSAIAADWRARWLATAMALGPWAMCYAMFSTLPAPVGSAELRLSWEYQIPKINWMIWIYSAAYPIAIAGPLVLRTQRELRRYVISAWLATFLGLFWMLLVPGRAVLLPLAGDDLSLWLVDMNRRLDAAWLALPSFHMLWTVLAAYCFHSRFPRLTPLWILMAVAIALSCILTGSHAIIDVLGGGLFGILCWHYERLWRFLVRYAESLANSWAAVRYGPVRVINHALWSFTAATVGMLVVIWLAGPRYSGAIALIFTVALLAAGAWGYWLEGGSRLSRPFGYYGFLFGAMCALGGLVFYDVTTAQVAMAAFACSAPLAQAVGRLRCLVQGCCHGRPTDAAPGLCIVNPQSRVVALGQLRGVAIHPTQLYSIIGNTLIFIFLWRLWDWGASAPFIGGFYLILSSLARFVEEQYRGEPQTVVIFTLPIYQWLAILMFLLGIIVSMLDGIAVRSATTLTIGGVIMALIAGLLAGFLMSVDFPASRARFSRLTVNNP